MLNFLKNLILSQYLSKTLLSYSFRWKYQMIQKYRFIMTLDVYRCSHFYYTTQASGN